jgi:hypothetical protein
MNNNQLKLLETLIYKEELLARIIVDGIGNLIKYRAGKRHLGPAMKQYLAKYARLQKGK